MNILKQAPLTAFLGIALSVGAINQAHAFAFNLSGAGDVSIKLDFYSAECDSTSSACNGGNIDNPLATMPPGSQPGNGTLNETTFGVGRITSIANEPGSFPTLWQSGQAGEQLMIFIYGVADKQISGPDGAGNFTLENIGCQGGVCDGKIHFDVYAVQNDQFLGFTGTTGLKVTDRTGFDTFAGITDIGELVFKSTFTQGARSIDGVNDLVQTTRATTLPTTGSGAWLADCVKGPACDWFDTNGQKKGADLFGQFTLNLAADPLKENGWIGYSNDPILTSTLVPEPGILSLLSIGLLGFPSIRRASKFCA